ncbi:MAG: 16S rRNA (cytidine(1402)-2'-O)-methyltransferase [Verrucomicrobia bacterium]|nr:16S rRNA (cytidine(1402)-2'-O)-methyltransferase [Verrucomicrobiota bacterium]|tara:strand:+ start:1052 stop:1738 length:687 start_codon:yes stop_codon:yes gene_type:complete
MSKLFIVPTPVGNLADMTYRSVETLQEVDFILCEDTRVSGKLLKHYNINKPLKSYHQHNEHRVVDSLVERIKHGEKTALITDAGTPGISDPAYLIVSRCVDEGIDVDCLPGATAFVPALINSALPTERFVFEGFLPPKKGRQTRLKALAEEKRTMVLYESPHKLLKTLQQLQQYFGEDRPCAICREISKMHEECIRGNLKKVEEYYLSHTLKGEIVMVIAGAEKNKTN